MEAIVHLDHPAAAMPSQSQMAYAQRTTTLHSRPTQGGPGDGCPYKPQNNPQQVQQQQQSRGGGPHSPAAYAAAAAANYNTMRYMHQAPYAPPPAPAPPPVPVSYRDNPYTASRGNPVVNDRGQNVEFVRNDSLPGQARPRISLLAATPDYLTLARNRHHQNDGYRDSMAVTSVANQAPPPPPPPPPQSVIDPPIKKIRLGELKQEIQTLRIETREENQSSSTYNPQVEAISPTLPPDVLQEESNFRTTKDDLLHGIAKVDREITKTELQISKLRKIQQELEEAAKKPVIKKEEEEVPQPSKHQSPAQQIYAENRKKAQEAHASLDSLGPKIELPLYNQPSDTVVYHENKRRHMAFKMKLLEHLRKKHVERENREKVLTATYSRLVQEWLRKVEKVENSQKRKAKEAKNREFFEKVFPKLRKQREDRERFNRVGARIKSEADLEEIMDGLQEQEMEDKKMRSYAVVPPLLLDARQRSVYYVNNNGRVDDFASDYKERQLLNVWTDAEKEIFKEKYLQHPKNFGVISSYLERKNVCDCVQYYYLKKKTENYKRLLRKSRQRTRSGRNPHGKVNSSVSGTGNSMDIISASTGVTTRLQRELQKQEAPQAQRTTTENTDVANADCDNTNDSSFLMPPQNETPLLLANHPANNSEVKVENKKKDRRKEEKKKKEEDLAETTDEEQFESQELWFSRPCILSTRSIWQGSTLQDIPSSKIEGDIEGESVCQWQGGECSSGITQACAVCKTESVCWRALPRSQASQYGLKEDQIPADARVCNLCRCKAVRSRYIMCPFPTCPNTKGHRVKRLRSMPCKWLDLPPAIKDPIAAEFQIDSSITKCCSACFNRISRRIGIAKDGNSMTSEERQALSPSQSSQMLRWTEEETEALKRGIKSYGTRWSEVSQIVGPTKSQHQCKNFFFNYRKKLGLDQIVQEYNKTHLGDERKPALTDEEESGSSTSSCDEIGAGAGDSDTASAASPSQNTEEKIDVGTEVSAPSVPVNPPVQRYQETIENTTNEETSEVHSQSSQPKVPPVVSSGNQGNKEDYDSSATETADEGQGGGETEVGATRPASPKQTREEDPSSPLTVKDLMLGVIEMQLMRNQGQNQNVSTGPGGPPTISSILNTDHSVTYPQREKSSTRSLDVNNSLATLSVVSSHQSHQSNQELPKEGLVVVQVQQALREPREPEPVTLDLSIKKPRDSNNSSQVKSIPQHPIPTLQSHSMFRPSQPPEQQNFYPQVVGPAIPPKLSPKLSPIMNPGTVGCNTGIPGTKSQCGSIIHGTPVSSPNIYNQSRYDQTSATLIRQVTPPHKETGSITQGTPVHQRTSMYPGEYYGKRGLPATSFYPPRTPAYSVEQRQIIMNDYITSQQMHGASTSANSRNSREKLFYQPSTRQGVIQRHNTKPPSPGIGHYAPPPPGHEAFSSLVDVAVRQPSLPVPPAPISISMSDHKSMASDEKRHLHEGLGERFNRDSPHERYSSREPERYSRENHKVHVQQSQSRDNHLQQQQQLRDQQIRDQQIRDHQLQHQQLQHHRERERELHHQQQQHHLHQIREQQLRERDHQQHVQQQKLRENHHLQQLQQRDMEQRSGRHQIPSYQPRLIHDPHQMPIDQRLIQVSPFSREQQPTLSPQQQPVSRSHSSQEQSVESNAPRSRAGESSTLTAASLIDAIITHQINQSSEGQNAAVSTGTCSTQQNQPTRPGDRLFQGFHRDAPESNGKISPMKRGVSPDIKGHVQLQQNQQQSGQQPLVSDHLEVFNSSQSSRPGSYQSFENQQTWKLRRALQHKDIEQSQGREKSEERNIVRFYTDPPGPVSLSPLDYVKNRIVEVMRTSEEEGATKSSDSPSASDMVIDESDVPASQPPTVSFITTPHTYTYPFSALSLSSGTAGVSISNQSMVKTGSEPIPEPAPLLSSQYEPLSDED